MINTKSYVFSQFEENIEGADGVDQPMAMVLDASIEPQSQHVYNINSDSNLRQDSPGRIMRIVPSDVDVSNHELLIDV